MNEIESPGSRLRIDDGAGLGRSCADRPAANTRITAASAAGANRAKNTGPKTHPKYLRVLVEADESTTGNKGLTTVNVRVPMQLLRAGVRLAALIPQQAHNQLDSALSSHGIPLTLSQIKPENLEELIDHLEDLTVDVDTKDGNPAKVRVFCE